MLAPIFTFSQLTRLANGRFPSLEISGPTPDVDIVLSVCLESDIPTVPLVKSGATPAQVSGGPVPTTSDLSGSSKSHAFSNSSLKHTRDRQSGKRKDYDSMSFLYSLFSLSIGLYIPKL